MRGVKIYVEFRVKIFFIDNFCLKFSCKLIIVGMGSKMMVMLDVMFNIDCEMVMFIKYLIVLLFLSGV